VDGRRASSFIPARFWEREVEDHVRISRGAWGTG
jgi:hypothetical protein